MSNSQKKLPYGLDDEIDLLEYLAAILRFKYWIVLFGILGGVLGYGLSYLMPVLYESFNRLVLVEHGDPGGVSPDNRRAPEVMTLVEHGFVIEQTREHFRDYVVTNLKSRTFTTRFMREENVLPHLFEENWDPELKKWKNGFKPDINVAFDMFDKGIRFVNVNEETGIMAVRMRWKNPVITAQWANRYVKLFNQHMRQKVIEDVQKKMAYLHKRLEKALSVEIQKAIYRLIEAQTAVDMLAQAKDDYALEVIDPAVPAYMKYSPQRKRLAILSFGGGIILGFLIAVGRVMLIKVRTGLQAYRELKSEAEAANAEDKPKIFKQRKTG